MNDGLSIEERRTNRLEASLEIMRSNPISSPAYQRAEDYFTGALRDLKVEDVGDFEQRYFKIGEQKMNELDEVVGE